MFKYIISFVSYLVVSDCMFFYAQLKASILKPIDYSAITIGGELEKRVMKNYDRLESNIYTPDKVFPVKHEVTSESWPGDYEGRVILGLTLEAQATHREPKYLSAMIEMFPKKLNERLLRSRDEGFNF